MIECLGMQKGTFPDLEALLNSLSEAVLMITKNTRVAYANKTAEEFFTTSSRKIVGKKLGELFPGMETLKHLVKKAVKELRSFSARDLAIRSLGDARADLDIVPFISDGICRGALLSIRKHVTIAERDDASFDSLVYLLGTIAHEIKNPLGGIKGAAQLLMKNIKGGGWGLKGDVTPRRSRAADAECLNLIIQETDRLNTVLQNYLTISKRPMLQQLNIHEVIEKAVSILDIPMKDGKIMLRRLYDPSLPRVAGDSGKLLQVFLNILKNALEAMPRGGNLDISTRPSDEHVIQGGRTQRWAVVSIRDSGRGIPQSEITKVFHPFYTRKKKGTGLGLALSKKIIMDHNGFIRVERPDVGKGTVFQIYIPFAP